MRDPELLGKKLLELRKQVPDALLSMAYDTYDECCLVNVPNYDPQPVDHAAERTLELQYRAQNGDAFAAALLRGDSLAEEPTE